MANKQDVTDVLLKDSQGNQPKDDTLCSQIVTLFHKIRQTVVVEPYLMLYIIASYPSYGLYQRYFYHAVGMTMGIDTNNITISDDNYTCGTEHANDTAYHERELVQVESAKLSMYIQLVTFIPHMLSLLIYGTYSDKLGRRLIFILPPIGAMIDCAITMCIAYFIIIYYCWFG